MKFRRSAWQIMVWASLCRVGAGIGNDGPARAQEHAAPTTAPTTGPTTAPATQIASPQDKALVAQMGADEFQARDAASEQLRRRGKAAMAALKEGADCKDPEIKTRCLALMKELDDIDKAAAEAEKGGLAEEVIVNGQVVGNIHDIQGRPMMMPGLGAKGSREATVILDGIIFMVHIDAKGMNMTATILGGGRLKVYEAKDVAALKKTDPEGYRIYQQLFEAALAGGGGGPATRPQAQTPPRRLQPGPQTQPRPQAPQP